jgi:hypothetical protein
MTVVGGVLDVDAGGATVAGVSVLEQRVLRRITTVRGGCIAQPNDGIDIRNWLRSGVLAATPGWIQAAVTAELKKEPGLQSSQVGVIWSASTSTLTLNLNLVVSYEPLAMTLILTSSNITVLVNNLPATWSVAA